MHGIQVSETTFGPAGDGKDRTNNPRRHQQATKSQTGFERDVVEGTGEARIFGQQALGDGEYLGEHGKGNKLKAEEHRNERIKKRMNVELDALEDPRTRQEPNANAQPQQDQKRSGIEK